MITKKLITIKTVEELANFAVAKLHYSATKFELRDSSERVWDDPEAGKAWLEEELQIRRPEEHTVETWWLLEKSKCDSFSSSSNRVIQLSSELGHLLDGIWKHRNFRDAIYTHRDSHGLTLIGMLIRLGKTDVAHQIKTALIAAEAKVSVSAVTILSE